MVTKSLDRKLAEIHADPFGSRAFILADAKDADMAFGIGAPGQSPEAHPGELRFKTLADYRDQIRAIARQGLVDIMLMSSSTSHKLTIEERLFDDLAVTPAVRANDTTDVHIARGSTYAAEAARPFRSADIDQIQCGHLDCRPEERARGANLGLYSVTFNNDLERDRDTLERFHEFRREAERKGFRYFLEVFDPNVPGAVDPEKLGGYINDMIARMLAGVAGAGRPQFLKIVYHGPRAMEELVRYDPHLVVGILGGASGTTRDAFQLLHDAKTYGARVALYGRKINNAENQLAFVQFLRLIADGQIGPVEAVRAYHAVLQRLGIRPHRPLDDDLRQQATAMSYGGSTAVAVPGRAEGDGIERDRAPAAPPTTPPLPSPPPSPPQVVSSPAPPRNGRLVTESAPHRALPDLDALFAGPVGRLGASANGHTPKADYPTHPDGLPNFARMDVAQRLAYHRRRLGLT